MSRSLLLLLLTLLVTGSACMLDDPDQLGTTDEAITVPPRGGPDTLDVGEWNLEFFGSTSHGPTNEALQLEHVRDVILGADLDLWALEEVVSRTQFESLVAQLPGYAGFLANDARVTSGSQFYTTNEQKVGVLFKSSIITVHSAKLIATNHNFDFGGRPPLELAVTATIGGSSLDFTFVIMHAKALSDTDSYNRRVAGSTALKAALDAAHPNDRLLLAGDINDDLDVSISGGRVSPYQNFIDDSGDYTFPTKALTDGHKKTTVNGSQPIDHHMVSNEMLPFHVAGSADVYRVDAFIPSYGSTTSDHFPTLTKYTLGSAPPQAHVLVNEILANEPGSSTDGEFVEIVNVGDSPADLSGATLSDNTSVRHVFAAGTTLAPGKAVVVFGAATGIPAGVTAVAASSGSLSLNNTGDTVTLADAAGGMLDSFAYTPALAGTDGVSMNRNPDASALGAFVLHTAVAAAASSPGTHANGSAF
jgi:endonuclease/exonuclease/phosphatase family metal-dependent hydrolase